MINKIIQISRYLLFTLINLVIYGFVLYGVFLWLSAYSFLCAYLGNLALIISILAADEYTFKILQSEKFVTRMKKEKNPDENYRFLQLGLDSVGSFKSDLYLFYVFILIGSQIIEFNPALVGENLGNFILANNYSILLLIAFDMLIRQFSNDRKKTKKILAKLKESLTYNQD